MTLPARGAPSNAQALQYVKCTMEHESGSELYLLQDVVVQVAPKGRPYNPPNDRFRDIDPDFAIYPIRGSFLRYQCSKPDDVIMKNVGKSCNSYDQPKAAGFCYKTTFGDWNCSMIDLDTRTQTRYLAPPR